MHMRPDRVIVGECRAGEALDMLQAMTTGHDGSLSTGHANTPKDMLRRLETMVLMTGYDLPLRAIREQIASAVDVIVHTARLKDGTRKIVNITEVYGIEDDEILTQDIFAFVQTDFRDGKIEGELQPTGIRPTFMRQFKTERRRRCRPASSGSRPRTRNRSDRSMKSAVRRPARGRDGERRSPRRSTSGRGKTVEGRRDGLRLDDRPGRSRDRPRSSLARSRTRRDAASTNLKAQLEGAGSSLDKVVWANWALREASEFDQFNEEWNRWFPGDAPIGQLTLIPPLQRRAGFRVSLGVIAEA